jgi:hypothetical protein
MVADKSIFPAANDARSPESRRRFREELAQIPTRSHPVYGSCLAPAYPSQLLIALAQLADLPIGAWRGQASIDWMLDPSLVRRYRRRAEPGNAPQISEAGLRSLERELIERARAAGLAGNLCELELLARLQHHGAATRLLDCSRNAFVALWFAGRWEPDRDGVLLGFELGDNAVHLDTELLRHDIEELLAMAAGRLLWWRGGCSGGSRAACRRGSLPSRRRSCSARRSTSVGDRSGSGRATSASAISAPFPAPR